MKSLAPVRRNQNTSATGVFPSKMPFHILAEENLLPIKIKSILTTEIIWYGILSTLVFFSDDFDGLIMVQKNITNIHKGLKTLHLQLMII